MRSTSGAESRAALLGLSATDLAIYQHAAKVAAGEQTRPEWATPLDMACALEPRVTVRTAALELIAKSLVEVAEGRCERLVISMPPQEGKSMIVSRRFPAWLLHRDPTKRIAIVSYEHGIARRWGRQIRNDLATHPELGLRVRADTSAAHEWQLDGHQGGVYTAGIGGALTGRPVDLMIVDDPVKGQAEADSLVYRDAAWDWWESTGSTRLAPGAPVILVLTRWHADDLAGRLLDREPGVWRVVNIPAQADHRPERGETDPLGREVGQFLRSARGRTVEQWEQIKARRGSRVWTALYQGKPSPGEGVIFKRDAWKFYDQPVWTVDDDGARHPIGMDEVLMSWDMAFKATDGSDFVVGQVWGRRGADAYLMAQVRARLTFSATVREMLLLVGQWPDASAKLVEDKANGTAVIDHLRTSVSGLIPVEPVGGKVARAAAVSPFQEAGNVWLPSPLLCPWVGDLVEEAAAFPLGSHDDQVDAMSQALYRLLGGRSGSGVRWL
jgi:predicted phage terminase large subunit-like protein